MNYLELLRDERKAMRMNFLFMTVINRQGWYFMSGDSFAEWCKKMGNFVQYLYDEYEVTTTKVKDGYLLRKIEE